MDRIASAQATKDGQSALDLMAQIEAGIALAQQATDNLKALKAAWQGTGEGVSEADQAMLDAAIASAEGRISSLKG